MIATVLVLLGLAAVLMYHAAMNPEAGEDYYFVRAEVPSDMPVTPFEQSDNRPHETSQ